MILGSKGQGHRVTKVQKGNQVAGVSYALYQVPSLSLVLYTFILVLCTLLASSESSPK